MRKRKLIAMIDRVHDRVNEYIGRHTDQSSKYSRGLAREGYFGGYVQALQDVDLASRGVRPNSSQSAEFWRDEDFD